MEIPALVNQAAAGVLVSLVQVQVVTAAQGALAAAAALVRGGPEDRLSHWLIRALSRCVMPELCFYPVRVV